MNIDMDALPSNLAQTLPLNCPPLVTADWVEDVFGVAEELVSEAIRIGRIPSIEVHGARSEIVVPVIRPRDAARLWGSPKANASRTPPPPPTAPVATPIPPVYAPAPAPAVSPVVSHAVSSEPVPVASPVAFHAVSTEPDQETVTSPADQRAARRVEEMVRIMVNSTNDRPKSVYMAAVEAGYVLPPPGENIGDPIHISEIVEGDVIVSSDGRMGVYIGKGDVLMEVTRSRPAEMQSLSDIVMSGIGDYRSGEVYRLRDN